MWSPPKPDTKSFYFHKHATKRINIAEGPVSSGKTVDSILKWLTFVPSAPPGVLFMIGKTERTLFRNVIRPMMDFTPPGLCKFTEGAGHGTIAGRRIDVIGFNNVLAETKIRGATCAGWLGDEITLWPKIAFEMLITRMRVKGGRAYGSTNPGSPKHWLKTDWLDNEKVSKDLFQLKYLLEDNEHLDPSYVEMLQRIYSGLFYKRFILGQWVAAEGAIYDMFDEDVHVFDGEVPFDIDNYVTGVDYGTSNPCTFGLYAIGLGPRWKGYAALVKSWRWDSKKKGRQMTNGEYAREYAKFIDGYEIRKNYVDPSAAAFIVELHSLGLPATQAKNDVIEGIQFVSSMFANNKFFLHKSCKDDIEEIEGYVWDEKKSEKGEDAPLKVDDHGPDRDRYVLYSHLGKKRGLTVFTA